MAAPGSRRQVVSCALYDWASSAFTTTVLAGFFPAFLQAYWSTGVDPTVTTARLGLANGVAGLIVALLAPLLGALADRGGHRKRALVSWSLLGILATAAFWFVGQGQWVAAVVLFVVAMVGYSAANVFYDSLLLDVAQPRELDRVSALGYSLGYLGGGLLFAVNVAMTLKPAWFGLADAAAAVRASFVTVAVWWLLFMLPLARHVREGPAVGGADGGAPLRAALAGLWRTLRSVASQREVALFLIAYWLYIDGVNTIIKMAVDYGAALGLPTSSLLAALLLTQFVAFPAALAFGWFGERIGPRAGIVTGLVVYGLATAYAFFLDTVTEFFALAVVIGLVQGGVQSLSRSFFGRLVPPGRSAEYFGFYNMMGKFATVLGPVMVALVALTTGSSRASILALLPLFLAGGLLLLLVRVPGQPGSGQPAGSSASSSHSAP